MSRALSALLLALLAADPGGGSSSLPVRVRTTWAGPAAPGQEVTLRLVPEKALEVKPVPESIERKVRVPGETVLEVPAGFVWRIETETPGVWSDAVRVSSSPDLVMQDLEVQLFPTGVLQGALEVPSQEQLPESLEIRFSSVPGPPRADRVPRASTHCPVETGQWKCSVPAGKLDVRLKAGDYVPVYQWDVDVKPAASSNLGKITLQQGSSVVGRVETEDGLQPGPASRLEISPLRAADVHDATTDQRLNALTLETRPNERGFFQFQGLPPGAYTVRATREGLTPASVSPVEVHAGLESEIVESLILARPASLRLELEPALDPYGFPWRVGLLPGTTEARGLRGAESFSGVATSEGTLEKHGLAPGPYVLRVSGEDRSTWVEQDVELKAGDPALQVRVPVIEIRGRISLGDEPLPATLWFGAPKGLRRVRFESDDEGRFDGWLPSEGTWYVDWIVEEQALPLKLPLEPVEVRVPEGKAYASVEIRVPDTRLSGGVVDEMDRPVPGATVTLMVPPARTARFTADAKGEFEIRGVTPGDVPVQAEEGDRSSGWVQARVEDGRESPWLRLVARRQAEIRGRVSSAAGPVPGAQIDATLDFGQTNVAGGTNAVSGPSGEFSLKLPGTGSFFLNLTVFAPGYALRLLRVPVKAGEILEIPVERAGGTLVVDSRRVEGSVLLHGGLFVPLQSLARWASLQRAEPRGRGVLVLPNVEIGEYAACRGWEAYQALRAGAPPPPGACDKGFVAPGQELLLKVPAQEEPVRGEPARGEPAR